MMKKVLILGSGGREYALAQRLAEEAEVFVLPGNAGTSEICQNVPLSLESAEDFEAVRAFIVENGVDLAVVGPEKYLEMGIVDFLEDAGISCFGTNRRASALESSKVYAKEFMIKYGIPTAKYRICRSREEIAACKNFSYPVVLKADGLAAGKGVIICEDDAAMMDAADTLFGISPDIVVEEFIRGTEASIMCFVDGETLVPMQPARDHKRLLDGDLGPNTGGMGAISGPTVVPREIMETFQTAVADRFMHGIADAGIDFRGVLFVGIMYTPSGDLYVLEFNTRFGDPETEVVLPAIEGSLYQILFAVSQKKLRNVDLKLNGRHFAVVVLAAAEYPYQKTKPAKIHFSGGKTPANTVHCGTSAIDGKWMATGGRVLAVTGSGETLDEAIESAYQGIAAVQFDGMQYRRDIGRTVYK